ncbi:MAG: HAD-IA family hydrolase [Cypionkella sp.]|nr:HAD-IA family hydrolase [Cypionkella sp.]
MKTVVFDLDGTLADTSGDLLAAANATFAALGHAPPLGAQDAGVALQGGRAMLRLGFARLNIVATEAQIAAHYPAVLAHYERAVAVHTRLYDGALDAVKTLRARGYACVICTNKPTYLAETLLQSLGLRDLFAALIGAGSLDVVKPDPAPYFAAVAAVGGTGSVMVGDTVTDHDTARAAGVPSILVGFGPNGNGVAALKPDAVLQHFDDLPDLVARLIG